MKNRTILAGAALTFLSACGGGGDAPPPATTDASTAFSLGPAYRALSAAATTSNYAVSGGCGGVASQTASAPVAGTFEGAAALVKTTTVTMNLTGCPGSGTTTSQTFMDNSYNPLGTSVPSVSYAKFQAPVIVPETVRLNDTAVLGTQTVWTSSTKTTIKGSLTYSYVVAADTPTSVIVRLIARSFTAGGTLQFTATDSYRLSGQMLTDTGKTVLHASGLSLTLTPR